MPEGSCGLLAPSSANRGSDEQLDILGQHAFKHATLQEDAQGHIPNESDAHARRSRASSGVCVHTVGTRIIACPEASFTN